MKKMPMVLIVEDEPAIAELIAVNLRHNGFQPVWAEDGVSAQRELDAVLPDVILLDWMLPGASGLSLARKWRADSRTKGVPILMLTARGDEPDKTPPVRMSDEKRCWLRCPQRTSSSSRACQERARLLSPLHWPARRRCSPCP